MQLKLMIFTLFCVGLTAYPLPQDVSVQDVSLSRYDHKFNQAVEKDESSKEVDGAWKSHLENSDLYTHNSPNGMAGEVRHKLSMESERLRGRLRQELMELRERLSPYPAHPQADLVSVRDRLAPLARQLQQALATNTQELCDHLNSYLQGSETAEGQAPEGPVHYREVVQRIGQSLDESHQKLTSHIQDFETKASGVLSELRDAGEARQEGAIRLEQEVKALGLEVQGRFDTLRARLSGLTGSTKPLGEDISSSISHFCQSSTTQNQLFNMRIEHLLGPESPYGPPPDEPQPSLEEFSTRLSALLQDIMHTVQ